MPSSSNNFILWENEKFVIKTPFNPHISYEDGLHLVLSPKVEIPYAWADPDIAALTFMIAAQACEIMEKLQLAPWFNIQANGNWGLLPGNQPFFHIHIYGRNKTATWAKPLVLPEAPKTYHNEPMPESDRKKIIEWFAIQLYV